MEVPREYLDNYTEALGAIAAQGKDSLGNALAAIDYGGPHDRVRAEVTAAMDQACGASSAMSARTASAFYDGLRQYVLGDRMGAVTHDGRVPTATAKAVRAFLRALFEDGDEDEFDRLCMERLDYEVRRAAGQCVQRNVGRDRYGDVRYARVPTGPETCGFCIMLASRGPVYHTPETAGLYDHYHPHCDCRVVPFWGTFEVGPSRRGSVMSVEGYDPDALYELYCELMLDERFRRAVARSGGGSGSETSHPQLWAQAYRDGRVTMRSFGEVENYLRGATDYGDLHERVKLVNKELPHYGLSQKYVNELRRVLRATRERLVEDDVAERGS